MGIIESFILQYQNNESAYELVRKRVKETLKSLIDDAGIMAIISARVKDPERLREKLLDRNQEAQYASHSDIVADIPDFIGARIALYFPNDKDKIEALLSRCFNIEKTKTFPSEQRQYEGYNRCFSGYRATHYRVRFKNPPETCLGNPLIEIQVASLLMHAWSEVEHDLAYKNKKGVVSFDEYESLDEINGLVLASEISLQRLQRLSQARIESGEKSIADHYQLSAYLSEKAFVETKNRNVYLGDVETLFQLLSEKKRLTRQKLDNDLSRVDFFDDIPIAQQLSDYYADKSAKDATRIISNIAKKKQYLSSFNAEDAQLGIFLRKWVSLERRINEITQQFGTWRTPDGKRKPVAAIREILPDEIWYKYAELRRFRNNLVHGQESPTTEDLETYTYRMEEILQELKNFFK